MKITQKLLGFIHRVFDKDPDKFLAFRLRYNGTGMTWSVSDGVLRTTVSGGAGYDATIDLSQYTLNGLAVHLSGLTGYSVSSLDQTNSNLSALILLDASGDQSVYDGDGLYGYTSLLFSYFESVGSEISVASTQVGQSLRQISTYDANGNRNAEGTWLDEIGSYYDTKRYSGETDEQYAPRVVGEVLRPRANNVALEIAIKATLDIDATVTDYEYPGFISNLHNGEHSHDGSITHDASGAWFYGLFDISYGPGTPLVDDEGDTLISSNVYPLQSSDYVDRSADISALVERLRDAGTHIHSISIV